MVVFPGQHIEQFCGGSMKSKSRAFITSLALAGLLAVGGVSIASADMVRPSRDFGAHVSMMATAGHPLPSQHGGWMFGDCVSTMAQTGSCDHPME